MANASGLFSTPYVPNFRLTLPSLSATPRFQAFKVFCSGTIEGAASTLPPSKSPKPRSVFLYYSVLRIYICFKYLIFNHTNGLGPLECVRSQVPTISVMGSVHKGFYPGFNWPRYRV